MMDDRQVQDADVSEARKLLRITAEEDEELSNVLTTSCRSPATRISGNPPRSLHSTRPLRLGDNSDPRGRRRTDDRSD
jgi:hypothetical protein